MEKVRFFFMNIIILKLDNQNRLLNCDSLNIFYIIANYRYDNSYMFDSVVLVVL